MILGACAKMPKERPPELYWPFPPEKPRVKFVDIILGSLDVTDIRSGKFRNIIFGTEGETTFIKPLFVAVRDGVMYVTDVNRIHVFDFKHGKFKLIGKGMKNATGIAVSADGTLYVGDSIRKELYMLRPGQKESTIIDSPGTFESPGGLAIDDANRRLIVPDVKKHRVRVYSLDGKFIFSLGERGSENGNFNYPYSAAVDGGGRIYVMDAGNFRVQIFDKDGAFLNSFGTVGSSPGQFARPKGIALDSEGHIYVIDSAFGNFQIFDADGRVYLSVGVSGSEPGRFSLPSGIAIDADDKIYVVDQMNMRVQIFQYLKYHD